MLLPGLAYASHLEFEHWQRILRGESLLRIEHIGVAVDYLDVNVIPDRPSAGTLTHRGTVHYGLGGGASGTGGLDGTVTAMADEEHWLSELGRLWAQIAADNTDDAWPDGGDPPWAGPPDVVLDPKLARRIRGLGRAAVTRVRRDAPYEAIRAKRGRINVDISICPGAPWCFVGPTGWCCPDVSDLDLHLPPDWIEEVLEPGDAVIDGHIVIEIRERDHRGRPTAVTALRGEYSDYHDIWDINVAPATVEDPWSPNRRLRFLTTIEPPAQLR